MALISPEEAEQYARLIESVCADVEECRGRLFDVGIRTDLVDFRIRMLDLLDRATNHELKSVEGPEDMHDATVPELLDVLDDVALRDDAVRVLRERLTFTSGTTVIISDGAQGELDLHAEFHPQITKNGDGIFEASPAQNFAMRVINAAVALGSEENPPS